MGTPIGRRMLAAVLVMCLAVACLTQSLGRGPRHGWWDGLGAVLPHDTFPADCRLCHVAESWHVLQPEFVFDHEAETGVPLEGAHGQARCLRCHNDRGPVAVFDAMGCAGCHEDVHFGQLGPDCRSCHQQTTWQPVGQVERHNRTRFPLVGVHASTSCRRCHVGAEVGKFLPTDVECLTCHRDDLRRANNPNHLNLGWVDRCDRCHIPTFWQEAEIDP